MLGVMGMTVLQSVHPVTLPNVNSTLNYSFICDIIT